jgi:hypothetical protein
LEGFTLLFGERTYKDWSFHGPYCNSQHETYLDDALGAVLAYMFGRWQAEHQRLYEERARVIADLFSRFEDVDQKFDSLFHWIDLAGEPDKREKASLAAQSFNELRGYYRRNSICLPPRTSARVREASIPHTG